MKYRVKPGRIFGALNQHKPGDVVILTEEEAKPFLDKLIPLGKAKPAIAQPAPLELSNDLDAVVPDELKLLQDSEEDSDGFNYDDEVIEEDAAVEKPKRTQRKKK